MTRTPDDIRNAIDTTLSGASHDPMLFHRVLNASKGDAPPVKTKLTFSMALVLALVLLTGAVALAAACRGVSWFLTEQTCDPIAIDPAYLMNALTQQETSQRLDATVHDAYWDGRTLSIAFHVTASAPDETVLLRCETPSHAHYRPADEADLLLQMPDFINITIGGEVSRPLGSTSDWVYEADGTLTVLLSFPLNDMSQPVIISVPIATTSMADGSEEFAMLHCTLPAMVDPVSEHVHDWAPATCVSPMVCHICGRTSGGLGSHDFQPEGCNVPRTCPICTCTLEGGHFINPDTPGQCYCGEIR